MYSIQVIHKLKVHHKLLPIKREEKYNEPEHYNFQLDNPPVKHI